MSAIKKNQVAKRGTQLPIHQRITAINIGELLGALTDFILGKIKDFFKTIRLKIKRKTAGWRFPWVRIALLGILAYVLLTRDMNFNLSLQAPIKAAQSSIVSDYKALPVVNHEPTVAVESEAVKRRALQDEKHLAYIKRFEDIAVTEMSKYGIPASIKMAQALLESGAGNSKLAGKNNNHFGIKCFSKQCRKGHCANFSDDHHKDFFRKYPTAWESWRDHSKFLTEGKYKDLLVHRDDYKAWAKGLKKHGYATDPTYADKLIATIELYELYKLDAK